VNQNSPGGLTLSAVTGTPFRGVVGTLTLPDIPGMTPPATIYAGVQWGDGTHSQAIVTPLGGGQYQVQGAHTYTQTGTYRVQAIVSQFPVFALAQPSSRGEILLPSFGGTADSTMNVTFGTQQPVPPAPQAVGLPMPDALGGEVENAAIAELQNVPPDPLSPQVYAMVDWGDGTPEGFVTSLDSVALPPRLVPSVVGGQYVLNASHLYSAEQDGHAAPVSGTFNVTVTFLLDDHDDPSQNTVLGTAHTSVNVIANTAGGRDIHANANVPFTANLGSFTADAASSVTGVFVLWGDNSTASVFGGQQMGDGAPVTLTANGSNSSYSVTGSHTYASAGEYVIQILATFTGPNSQQVTNYHAVMSTAIAV
jgi:hypothetical protein